MRGGEQVRSVLKTLFIDPFWEMSEYVFYVTIEEGVFCFCFCSLFVYDEKGNWMNETDFSFFCFHVMILDVAWVFLLPYFAANESFIYRVPLTCL